MSERMQKVGNVIQREVAQLFAEVLDDSEYGLVTVTKVVVLPDLSEARIYVSVMGDGAECIEMLERRRGRIRRIVGPRLFLKKIPKFTFLLDTTAAAMERMEKILERAQ